MRPCCTRQTASKNTGRQGGEQTQSADGPRNVPHSPKGGLSLRANPTGKDIWLFPTLRKAPNPRKPWTKGDQAAWSKPWREQDRIRNAISSFVLLRAVIGNALSTFPSASGINGPSPADLLAGILNSYHSCGQTPWTPGSQK